MGSTTQQIHLQTQTEAPRTSSSRPASEGNFSETRGSASGLSLEFTDAVQQVRTLLIEIGISDMYRPELRWAQMAINILRQYTSGVLNLDLAERLEEEGRLRTMTTLVQVLLRNPEIQMGATHRSPPPRPPFSFEGIQLNTPTVYPVVPTNTPTPGIQPSVTQPSPEQNARLAQLTFQSPGQSRPSLRQYPTESTQLQRTVPQWSTWDNVTTRHHSRRVPDTVETDPVGSRSIEPVEAQSRPSAHFDLPPPDATPGTMPNYDEAPLPVQVLRAPPPPAQSTFDPASAYSFFYPQYYGYPFGQPQTQPEPPPRRQDQPRAVRGGPPGQPGSPGGSPPPPDDPPDPRRPRVPPIRLPPPVRGPLGPPPGRPPVPPGQPGQPGGPPGQPGGQPGPFGGPGHPLGFPWPPYWGPPPAAQNGEQTALAREAKIETRKPDPFSGKERSKWKGFLSECLMTFYAKPITYRSDHARVTFAASYLTDHAQKHYITLLQYGAAHPATQTWVDFVAEFGYMFGVVNTQVEAQQNLRILQMHDRERFSTFIIRFEENSFESGWNDTALLSELYRALPLRIKEVLKTLPRSRTVQELRDLVMSIDHRHWEYEEENRRTANRVNWVPPFRQPPPRPSQDPRNEGQEGRTTRPAPERRNPAPPEAKPVSSNRPRPADRRSDLPRITPEERERRRRENLCYRCGGEGHLGSSCPKFPTISRAIFTVDGEEVGEEYDEDEPEPEPPDLPEEPSENDQAIQELPGTD